MKVRPRKGSWILFLLCAFGMIFSSPAKAEGYTVSSVTDFYFYIQEPTEFSARTYMYDGSPDTHLWLYGINNELLIANDDYYGLQSFLSYQIIEPGIYRLRAGVCCGDPDAWRGNSYELFTSLNAIIQPEETTTTTQSEETTTTTLVEETTTTTSTTVEESTTTTTTVAETIPANPIDSSTTTTLASETTTTTSSTTLPKQTSTSTSTSTTTLVEQETTTTSVSAEDTTTTTEPLDNTKKAVEELLKADIETITPDQAKAIFENINVNELTEEQKIELVLIVNKASEEVKKEFEKSVDVFGSGLDNYVPSGSNINVGARRAIIAVTTVLSTIAISVPSSGTITNKKQ